MLLSSPHTPLSDTTKAKAFIAAMALDHSDNRNTMIIQLLDAQLPLVAISGGSVTAVTASDLELIDPLLRFGASLDHNDGQAIVSAVNSGRADSLKLIVQNNYERKPSLSTLTNGFLEATWLMDRDADVHFAVVAILLEAGARGDEISNALLAAVQRGDQNLRLTELLCKHEASVES
jgi:hypothetical protein